MAERPKHTPGPWEAQPEEAHRDYIRIRGTQLGLRYKVANVLCPMYPGVADAELLETRANARLIAAAPELLEALKVAREWIVLALTADRPERIQIDAAIAKAEGK